MSNISLDFEDCSTDSYSRFKYFFFDFDSEKSEAVYLVKYTEKYINLHFIGLDKVSHIEHELPLDVYNQIVALGDDVLQVIELVKTFFQIPPTTTTDNKDSAKDHTHVVTKVGEVDKGVVDSVGEALFTDCFTNEIDTSDLYEHPAAKWQPQPPKKSAKDFFNQSLKNGLNAPLLDDDIPPIFAESGIFSKAE